MPELPELEVVCEVLNRRVVNRPLTHIEMLPPGGAIVVRDLTGRGLDAALTGECFAGVQRRGKFLIFIGNGWNTINL